MSAPQVNEFYRIVAMDLGTSPEACGHAEGNNHAFLMDLSRLKEPHAKSSTAFTMFNPVITQRSQDFMTMWDDCMSFPDLMVGEVL